MLILEREQMALVGGAGDKVRVQIDWNRDGQVDEAGYLEDGKVIGDSGRNSASWEWDNDAMTNWWDNFNPINDAGSAINQAIDSWLDALSTGNVGTATGQTVGDAPEILGNAVDAGWRWLVDEVASSLADSYDIWDVVPAGQTPQEVPDAGSPAVNDYVPTKNP